MLKRFGNFLLALLVFVVSFLVLVVIQNAVVIFAAINFGMPLEESTPLAVFAGHVGFIVVFGLWYGILKSRYAKRSIKKVATPRNLGGLLVLSLGLSFFMSYGLAIADPLIPEAIVEEYMKIMENAQLGESLLTNLAGCFLAPIGEELIFRGLMLYFLMKVIRGTKNEKVLFWVVNLIQAVCFGAFHMNLYQGMYATVLGMLIGYMAYKSNTILVPILIHMIYNVSQLVLMEPIGTALPENTIIYVLLMVAGLVVMIVGMRIVKFHKEESVKEEVAA
ncbi:MAG: CPBP family intramembrane metalloprotease [Lachnospiraceae bacterium]|nr:CPBP family intramembrane metalloprotease [Lachnospiraceae bacterium]